MLVCSLCCASAVVLIFAFFLLSFTPICSRSLRFFRPRRLTVHWTVDEESDVMDDRDEAGDVALNEDRDDGAE